MAPKWGNGYGRKGAALTGLGPGGEAVKAYTAGSKVELTLAREDGAPTTVVVTRKKYALVPVVGLSKFANPVDP